MSSPENTWFQQRCIDWKYEQDLSRDEELTEVSVAIGELHVMLQQIERGWWTIRTIRDALGVHPNAILPSTRLTDMIESLRCENDRLRVQLGNMPDVPKIARPLPVLPTC